jgi:hypothetical protein
VVLISILNSLVRIARGDCLPEEPVHVVVKAGHLGRSPDPGTCVCACVCGMCVRARMRVRALRACERGRFATCEEDLTSNCSGVEVSVVFSIFEFIRSVCSW